MSRHYSKIYVNQILSALPSSRLHLNTRVERLQHTTVEGRRVVEVKASRRSEMQRFDRVILACHSDTAFNLLRGHSYEYERRILGSFRWNTNEAVLHSDSKVRYLALERND